MFYLGLWPVYPFCISTLHSMSYSFSAFLRHRCVPEFCRGCVGDPRTTLLYLYFVTFSFNFV